MPAAPPPVPTTDMPPVYPRSTISDPRVAEVASEFAKWGDQQQFDGKPAFQKIEVLPPVQSLEPYGIGTYQRSLRLPVVITTGPGWDGLPADHREEVTAALFTKLLNQLEAARPEPAIRPTVTIQTPEGLELAWVNSLSPGRRLLHGDGE
jgi:hypothetical protein